MLFDYLYLFMFGLICLMFDLLLLLVLMLIWVFMGFDLVYRLVLLVGLVGLILLGFYVCLGIGQDCGLFCLLLFFVFGLIVLFTVFCY